MLCIPLKEQTLLSRRVQHIEQSFVAKLREEGSSIFHFCMLHGTRQHFGLRGAFPLPEERLDDEIQNVLGRHETQKPPQETGGLQWMVEYFVEKQLLQPLLPDSVDHFTRQAGGVDF